MVITIGCIKKIICYIGIFYLLFCGYFANIPIVLQQVLYWGGPIFFITYKFRNILFYINKYVFISILLLFTALIWGVTVITFSASDDFSYIYKIMHVYRYMSLFLLFYVVVLEFSNGDSFENISKWYIGFIFILISSTLYFCVNYEDRFLWQSLFVADMVKERLVSIEAYIMRFSIIGFTGFEDTLKCSLGMLFSWYLITRKKKIGYIGMILSIIGNFFYGRIGVIISAIYIVFLFLNRDTLKFVIVMLLFFIGCYFSLLMVDDPYINLWLLWICDPVESFFSGLSVGQLTFGGSADTLIERMYFPIDDETLMHGDGKYTTTEGYYMHTDAGFMRILLFGGIPMMVLVYGAFLCLSYSAYIRLKKMQNVLKRIVLPLVIAFFISEYKGDPYPFYFGIMFLLNFVGNRSSSYDNKHIRQIIRRQSD